MKALPFLLVIAFLPVAILCKSPETKIPAKDAVMKTDTVRQNIFRTSISFPSLDGLTITADNYLQNDTLPWILLCHQAGYSRGEYGETAAFFASAGYNCLAIDQRSGDEVNGVKNETAALAKAKKLPTSYLDAEQDILAALNYLFENSKKPVILVGSSYSAGLVMKIAVNNPKVKAVLAFSPGEYYKDKLNLTKAIAPLDKPVFVTSSKEEVASVKPIFDAIASKNKTQFIPSADGIHGSKALWSSTPGFEEYRKAVAAFLLRLH
jgi:pimeloyl-ACP methyl ester carboxylesterase